MGSMKRLFIFIMFFKSPDCRLLSPSVPSSVTIQLSTLNELRKNCSSLSASNTDEGDRHSLTQPNFPLWEQFHAKKSLALSCAALKDGSHREFETIPLTLSNVSSLWEFFAPTVCWHIVTKILDFQNVTLIQGWLSILVFFGGKDRRKIPILTFFWWHSRPRSLKKNKKENIRMMGEKKNEIIDLKSWD